MFSDCTEHHYFDLDPKQHRYGCFGAFNASCLVMLKGDLRVTYQLIFAVVRYMVCWIRSIHADAGLSDDLLALRKKQL